VWNLDLRNLDEQIVFEGRLVSLSKGQKSTVLGRQMTGENLRDRRGLRRNVRVIVSANPSCKVICRVEQISISIIL
jgi:hypothetical protein